jgi:hypothetical protein
MSIQAEILQRMSEGRLVALTQVLPGPPDQRQIFAVPSVMRLFDGPWETPKQARRAGAARGLLEGFLRGDEIVGRWPPSKDVNTVIALLEPPVDNVWEFRIGHPRPGLRILGRFAERDVFIATNWLYREDFRDSSTGQDDQRKWRDEVIRSKTIWMQLFPPYDAYSGSTLHDFISRARLPI